MGEKEEKREIYQWKRRRREGRYISRREGGDKGEILVGEILVGEKEVRRGKKGEMAVEEKGEKRIYWWEKRERTERREGYRWEKRWRQESEIPVGEKGEIAVGEKVERRKRDRWEFPVIGETQEARSLPEVVSYNE